MVSCPNPSCRRELPELTPTCLFCQADLSLLVNYVGALQAALDRAQEGIRAGELGKAVWAYLEVLEVDPDNAEARRQVGQVAAAVRAFDRTAPGRRGAEREAAAGAGFPTWLRVVVVLVLMAAAFFSGYQWSWLAD